MPGTDDLFTNAVVPYALSLRLHSEPGPHAAAPERNKSALKVPFRGSGWRFLTDLLAIICRPGKALLQNLDRQNVALAQAAAPTFP